MKKKLVSILLVAAMVISLVACGDNNGSSSGKKNDGPFIINVCIASEPETIDPGLISSVDGSTYTQHQFEGLMKYAPTSDYADESKQMFNSDITFGQAKSVDISDDGRVYTITLRDDIYWS
ncbi:MAG: hypothetical protein IJR23_05440, partial [Lachnospiraceae bacterium]|nr:hypothetical protein [Lachnospiraceae bacterium]